MLRKRALVEYVNDELKNIAQIEHSGSGRSQISSPMPCVLSLLTVFFKETIDFSGVRVGQSIDVVLIAYIELPVKY